MKNGSKASHFLLFYLLACVFLLTACSYTTNFVVVNASDHTIEVRYKIKKPVDPTRMFPVVPAIKAISELDRQIPWRDLSTSELKVDPENRTVVVFLMPGNGLRVEHRNLTDGPQDDASRDKNFSIEEIVMVGASGEVSLKGEQVRKSFAPASKSLYTLTYH